MKIRDCSLYWVSSEEYSNGKTTLEIAKDAIKGGIDIIQMREKQKSHEELIALGKELSELCRENNVMFIINDDPQLTKELSADGVHLGQEDIAEYPIEKTRKILGEGKIIGLTTHSIEEVKKANALDVDYIAYGPIFPTQTKDYSLGTEEIKEIAKISNKPVFFIGGININNVSMILDKGGKNIAAISAITLADDVALGVKSLKEKIKE